LQSALHVARADEPAGLNGFLALTRKNRSGFLDQPQVIRLCSPNAALGHVPGCRRREPIRMSVAGVGEIHRVQSKDVAAVRIIYEWLTTTIGARRGPDLS
jgi:hypothetical protein